MRQLLIGGLWLALCFGAFSELLAQAPEAESKGIEKFEITQTGIGIYRPEKWATAQVNLRNSSSREINLLASTHLQGDTTLQYARQLWVPPKSIMNSWHLIKMPKQTPGQRFFELRTLVTTTEGGVETRAKNEMGAMQFDQAFQIHEAKPVTAAILQPDLQDTLRGKWANAYDLLLTARYEQALTKNLYIIMAPVLPATEEAWDVVDHLVIGDNRILNDSAGIGAIRRWVAAGGSLWVMADLVSPELLEKLMGDEAAITVVDRVTLEHVKVEKASGGENFVPFERDLDRPTPLVRVIAENVEPAFTVNGWPAAFWKSYGEGRILVTTLGTNGWLSPRKPEDRPSNAGVNSQTIFTGSEPLNNLTSGFFVPRPQPAFNPEVAEEQIRETSGYSIPSRSSILGTLLAFTTVVGISAWWLSRTGHLEWLGAATPLAAIISAGVLIAMGNSSRSISSNSNSTSVLQLIQAVPGTDDVRTTGVAGILIASGESKEPLAGQQGGLILPEMSGMEGVTRRLTWTDIDRWSWDNMTQKPGLRTALMTVSGPVPHAVSAEARITGSGIAGRIQLPKGLQMSDAILATPSGRVSLKVTNDGQWTADANSELLSSQYLQASVLSDEQQRRSRILAEQLKPQPNKQVPAVPTIFVWTQPWDQGFSYGLDAPVGGSALVAIPLNWTASEAGQECTLPRPLLAFQEVTGPDGFRPSNYFSKHDNNWQERSGVTTSWIAFDLPHDMMPLTLKRAEVTFKVKGAIGRLEISGFKDGKLQSIQTWNDPIGTLTHTIEDVSLIPLDAKGRFLFRVDAGTSNAEAFKNQEVDEEASATPVPSTDSNIVNYYQFEEISARVTVATPSSQDAPVAAP